MPTRTVRSLLAAALLAAAGQACAAVWAVTARWDEAAEQRFAQWVEARFVPEFFYEDSPYAGIATDCADAAYGMRIAFAYEHGLPFVIGDPEQPGRTLSQSSPRFDHLPAGLPRVRAFMDWIATITSTATLADDTYPIRIDREQVRPGTIVLAWRTHVVQVVSVREDGVLRYLESTSPRAIRVMTSITGFPHQVPGDPKARRHGDGFRRFRWPEHYGVEDARLPGHGTEQFVQAAALGRDTFAFHDWVRTRLARVEETPLRRARRQVTTLCKMAWDRAGAIDEARQALAAARAAGRRCLSAPEVDAHSTPGRDLTLRRAFEQTAALADRADWPSVEGRFRHFVEAIAGRLAPEQATGVRSALVEWCDIGRVDGGPGRPMDLAELARLAAEDRLVGDPHAPPAQRWGLEPYVRACAAGR